jgi:hypothetical protein
MSDDLGYLPSSAPGAVPVATDRIGDRHFQRIKLTFGADGTATDVTASDPLPVALPGLSRAEDSAHSSGDAGIMALAVRRDDELSLVGTDGDYAPLSVNAFGRLKVSVVPAFQDAVVGNITTNTGQVAINVARTSNVALHCVNTGVAGATFNFEASLNSTNGTDGNWFAVQVVRTNANTIETAATAIGATPVFGWEGSVNGYVWFRVRASAGTFGTSTWTIQPAPYATEPVPAAQISGTQPVSGTVTANIGTGALAAGANLIGDTGLQVRANATGAASTHHIVSAATTNVAQIKATAGRVYGYCLSNTNAAWRYVKLHNVASATAGAAVAVTIGIPPNGKAECMIPMGFGFATAISRSIVAGAADADATAVGANDVVGDIFFA